MADDTRDIAIQTRTDVVHLTHAVTELTKAVGDLKDDLNERRGAEKLARAVHTVLGGAAGAAVVKGVSWLGALPK